MSIQKFATEIRREQTARAALELIATQGMKGFNVARLARRGGVAPSARDLWNGMSARSATMFTIRQWVTLTTGSHRGRASKICPMIGLVLPVAHQERVREGTVVRLPDGMRKVGTQQSDERRSSSFMETG
jgi:hypothetical protein